MSKSWLLVALLWFLFGLWVPAQAVDGWPQWRGPSQNGVLTDSGYPVHWGDAENVRWKKPIPGWGTSTPVICDDQIVVTAEVEGANALIGLNRAGDTLWTAAFGPASPNRNQKASSSNPSPVTDGSHVYAYYKSGDLACVDLAGRTVWQRNLQRDYGPDRLWWDLGTSPVLTDKLVIVAVMHQGPSYLVALDKQTGQQVWQTERDVEAPGESRDSYTTPLVVPQAEGTLIVTLGADHVTAHAADTGDEVWRAGGLNPSGRQNFRSIASPVIVDDLVIAPYARGGTLSAIRLGGHGDVTDSHVVWSVPELSADVPSPIGHAGRIYVCGDRGDVHCLDSLTGKLLWTERLPRNRYPFSSSPVLVGDNLYLTREDGTTFVLRVGERPELIATNQLRENTYATPAFDHGQIYLRTSNFLFCLGGE